MTIFPGIIGEEAQGPNLYDQHLRTSPPAVVMSNATWIAAIGNASLWTGEPVGRTSRIRLAKEAHEPAESEEECRTGASDEEGYWLVDRSLMLHMLFDGCPVITDVEDART